MFSKSILATLAIGLLLASPAMGVVPADLLDYEVRLPHSQIAPVYTNPTDAEAAQLLPSLADFRTGEGAGWKIMQWNSVIEAPASLAGPAIPVVGSGASEDAIRSAVEAFIARNAELVRAQPQDLRFGSVTDLSAGKQYVIFDQYFDGIPVLGGRVDVGLWEGRVILVGSDFYPGIQVNRYPLIDDLAAGRIAHQGIPESAQDAVEGSSRLVILPIQSEGTFEYHLAWELHLRTADPENLWRTYVDAHSGTILWRESEYAFYQINGTVRGNVEETYQNFFDYPLEDARVQASGSYTDYTNEAGEFSITVPNNTDYSNESQLLGYYVNVNNYNGSDAVLNIVGGPGDAVDFFYDNTNSAYAEVDAFYHVNVVHDWIKWVDPAFNDLDYMMIAAVERSGSCNAYWNGSSVNFYRAGGGCASFGRIADVIYHEYQHGITQWEYYPYSAPTGSGMGEGFSDVTSFCIHPDHLIGEGAYGGGGAVRDAENLRQYPGTECGGEVHCLGEIIMGAMWKVRKNFVIRYGEEGTPPVYDFLYMDALKTKQFSMPNYLTRLLMADDDDGDLTNGTEHWYDICDGFILHNLPCPNLTNYVVVTSDAIDDQPQESGDYEITALAVSVGPGSIDPNQVDIYYTTDPLGGNPTWETAAMSPTGNPDEFAGAIPNLGCGERVYYYVQATKYTGESATAPFLAPYRDVYQFMTGPYTVALDDDLETDQGWTLGWATDDATEGFFERVDPTGKTSGVYGMVQPEDDHTPGAGTQCFVTDGRGGGWYSYDVDNGVTSVVSPTFDWSSKQGIASVRFWTFFFDDSPNDDSLRLFGSNDDGATWEEIFTMTGRDLNDWIYHKVYFTDTEIPFTNQMRFRFTMEDIGNSTTCAEAAIDDIEIRVNDCNSADADDLTIPLAFTVEQNKPNPFNPRTAIRFGLPSEGRVEVRIYDATGREVRTLQDGNLPAGYHTVMWDGRDDQNHSVGSGVYYYTVKSGKHEGGEKMLLLK